MNFEGGTHENTDIQVTRHLILIDNYIVVILFLGFYYLYPIWSEIKKRVKRGTTQRIDCLRRITGYYYFFSQIFCYIYNYNFNFEHFHISHTTHRPRNAVSCLIQTHSMSGPDVRIESDTRVVNICVCSFSSRYINVILLFTDLSSTRGRSSEVKRVPRIRYGND